MIPLLRVGHGYDAHRFAEGRRLVLGGVEIEHSAGLDGHSDADAALHALMDAMLGAARLGDIGRHFPDTDEAFKDISSLVLLERVVKAVAQKGYALQNADVTIVAQAPRLAPYLARMEETIAAVTGGEINVKATTEERMGFTGRKEGVACHAVVLLGPA